jgi:signal transduction histidine kinase/CheY-like chemotaxis protein
LEVINILNGPEQLPDCIQCVLTTLKRQAKFDAVAIRLKDGEDFPYFAQQGFSEDFLLTENTLLELDADGKVCRDDSSKVKLECICGLVISGKTDPTNQLFTTGGSYWVNDLSEILNIQPSEDILFHPRNQCLHHGYSSVALVPIRNKEKIIGLLQLNGRRKRCFTLNTVELLEGIALHIGVALMRRRAEEENAKLETQFQLAQKIESIGQLAGGVAHDFNNMLGVILGHSELAMNQIDPNQPYFFDLEKIHQAATRSADITRQLLTFARKQAISPKILNVNETVESLLSMLRRLIGANINLIWMPGNTLWPVKADPSQIDQILINLCVNARDAIGGIGKIIVETGNSSLDKKYCAAHPDVVPGEYVRIAVSDNGCGMDKETLLRIFEPFFTTKEIGKGTGLGLASVYGAVKQNKGFINVCSEPNFDTVFTIYLPRHLSSIEQVSVDRAMKPAARGHETILLVEDEPDILMMTTKILKSLGYFVLAVGAPGEAIQLVSQLAGEIHLLLTDVVMPEMNGRDLANKLLTFQPEVKCLFMSGYTADIISDQGVLAHGLNFIQKPFSVTDLAFKIREALEKE